MALDKLSSKERADIAVAAFQSALPNQQALLAVDRLVGKEQNGPPDGTGDGTLGEARWKALRDLVLALSKAQDAIDRYWRP